MWWVFTLGLGLAAWTILSVRQLCFPKPRTLVRKDLPVSWTQRTLSATDGRPLVFWHFPNASPKARLLLCHGFFANRHQVQPIASRLAALGFEVLVMELRGHGQRLGPCTFGLRERQDALQILQWADSRLPGCAVGLLGFSMGAAVLCAVASSHGKIKAFVADSIYVRLFPVLSRGLWQEYHVPAFPFAWCTWMGLQVFLGARLGQLDAAVTARNQAEALLLIEGGQDRRVPRHWVDDWYAHWQGYKERWRLPQALHVGAFAKDPDGYVERIADFFGKTLA